MQLACSSSPEMWIALSRFLARTLTTPTASLSTLLHCGWYGLAALLAQQADEAVYTGYTVTLGPHQRLLVAAGLLYTTSRG